MKHDLTPWLDYITDNNASKTTPRRDWFRTVFEMVSELGFELQEDEMTIMDGGPLTFMRDHAQVVVTRWVRFPIGGESAGIQLSDEMESHEQVMSVRTPLPVVRLALDHLNPAPVVEPSLP